ncbi:Cytochrome c oxidase subunit VIIc protein [Dioscorea alata]|uniref:Cytochrome c oxidase subunit VIIc protein n=1 Tax=Dioscorea alata TaxID=55571 RepID=A0ACB7VF19_DIOAL|nr:Cytochrome c oxidase subunit VIIc protein [Dioscorea alata]
MGSSAQISASKAFTLHLLCALGFAAAWAVACDVFSWTLVAHPALVLRLLFSVHAPFVIVVYSMLRREPEHCPFWKAVGRGLLAIPVGALLNAFGAIVLGAPVGTSYLPKTIYWSLLMSLFTFVPAACVVGSSRTGWQSFLLANSRPIEELDCMIILPAYGAIIGSWFGAWPMPLDWERPWQEWPICVTYGAVIGYLMGMLVLTPAFILGIKRKARVKGD